MFEQIITELYNDKSFNKYFINKKYPQYSDDLKNEIFEYLLKMDKNKIINLYNNNELKKYVRQIIINQNYLICNKNIKSFDKYKDLKSNYDYLDNYDYHIENNEDNKDHFYKKFDLYEYVKQNKILSWYEFEIFEAYFQIKTNWLYQLNNNDKLTQEDIAKIIGVGREKINLIIKNIKTKIKNNLIKNNIYYDDNIDYSNTIN